MNNHKNLLVSFVLGLAYFPVLYILAHEPGSSILNDLSVFHSVVIFSIVILSLSFAIRSILKKESMVGAITVIIGNVLLFILTLVPSGIAEFW